MRRRIAVALMIITMLAAGGASAQEVSTEATAWKAFASSHVLTDQVAVRLKDGRRYKGTIVSVEGDTFQFKPRTRVPVPAGQIAFADVDSIVVRKPGLSPGSKVVIGVGAAAGTILLAAAVAIAAIGY